MVDLTDTDADTGTNTDTGIHALPMFYTFTFLS